MAAIEQPRRLSGSQNLALTLLFMAPSTMCLFASYALVHEWLFSASALWLVYETSLYLGIVGAVLAGSLTVAQVARRHISVAFVWLMGIVTAATVWIVWYAAHIYRSPWGI